MSIDLAAALRAITEAVMPVRVRERKPLSPEIAAKLGIRVVKRADLAKAMGSLAAIATPGHAAAPTAHAKAPAVLKAQADPADRKPLPARPDISIAKEVHVVGDKIRIQLSPKPEVVRAVKAGLVPEVANVALSKALEAYPGASVEVYGGKTHVLSSPATPAAPVDTGKPGGG